MKIQKPLVMGVMLCFTLSACLGDKPVNYANIKPSWQVNNSPIPVPYPRLKPKWKLAKSSPKRTKTKNSQRGRTVTVQRGDTLYAISRITKISVKNLIRTNNLRAPYQLNKGQILTIPTVSKHKVRKGETLYALSRQYGVDVRTLARTNGLRAPFALTVGQELVLTGGRKIVPKRSIAKKQASTQTAVAKRKAARKSRRASAIPAQQAKGFLWPVTGPMLSSFGAKPNGIHNDGINIKVGRGTSIKSAESGLVAYVGSNLGGWGNLVLIKHQGGWLTAYAHADKILVRRGDVVRRGQVIAKAGSTGHVTSPQVHFELRRYKQAINPQRYLNKITS